ncbi:NACHT domain-containing protein [Allokutzneria albata]|nr:NACHT domain-containing protein [Allokutzneria albata]
MRMTWPTRPLARCTPERSVSRSSTSERTPARAGSQASIRPLGPAPAMMTSACFALGNLKGCGDADGIPVEAAIGSGTRVLLRGDAGSGKTTLLHWLAVRAARAQLSGALAEWNDCVPFVILLRTRGRSQERVGCAADSWLYRSPSLPRAESRLRRSVNTRSHPTAYDSRGLTDVPPRRRRTRVNASGIG